MRGTVVESIEYYDLKISFYTFQKRNQYELRIIWIEEFLLHAEKNV